MGKIKDLETKARFAALYVTGTPRTRGNWAECNAFLHTAYGEEDEDILRLIADENGALSPAIAPLSNGNSPAFDSVDEGSIPSGAMNEDWRLQLKQTPQSQDEWCKMAESLRPTIQGIADGTVKASAAQARILLSIQERCYGRVDTKQEDKQRSGILILPTLGTGSEMKLCPQRDDDNNA